MRISELFKNKIVLSFEVFPPKPTVDERTIFETLNGLKELRPDFISVTYGAGGGSNCSKTLEIVSAVKNKYGIESAVHLPCINISKDDVLDIMEKLKLNGIENILALRGDISPDIKPCGDFNIIAACYPEGHPESENIVKDVQNLKIKADAGANHFITQLFLDNDYFYSFRERIALAGINIPIEAGIMPVTNKKSIERMVKMCGVHLPKKFMRIMDKYEHNPEALRDAGIAYAIDQIVDLITQGVDGIHLYTMNKPYVARKIYEAVKNIINV